MIKDRPMNIILKRCEVEKAYEIDKWIKEIPYILLPSGYEFKPLPNFAGSVARFWARKKGSKQHVSIYFDPYMELGHYSEPYWELYPDVDGDTFRCAMNETEILSKQIVKAIRKLERKSPKDGAEGKE